MPSKAALLEKALSRDPTYAAGFKNLAAIQFQMGSPDPAVAAMRAALRASPTDPELQETLIELLALQSRRRK